MTTGAISRRDLFTRWFRPAAAAPSGDPKPPVPAAGSLPGFLRPPGAALEEDLVKICERCHKCKDACPHDVILPLGPAYGEAEGTPAILPRGGPCRLCEDLPCAAACPSGALEIIPLSEVRMGTALLDPSLCWSVQGQPCDYCIAECPLGEVALRWKGDRPEIDTQHCAGCGMCVHICTATPGALRIIPPAPPSGLDASAGIK